MGESRVTDTPAVGAGGKPRRYLVVIEMVQVFTQEIELDADTVGMARAVAQEMIDADALGHLEFQDLTSTEYRVASVQVLA